MNFGSLKDRHPAQAIFNGSGSSLGLAGFEEGQENLPVPLSVSAHEELYQPHILTTLQTIHMLNGRACILRTI